MPCEVCEGPTTHTCAGLDVPMLSFCAKHAEEHRQECPDIASGRALITKHATEAARPPKGDDDA